VPRQPATWLHISGYRFLLRRLECALLDGDVQPAGGPMRAQSAALTIGCALAAIAAAAAVLLGLLRPRAALDRAQIVMDKDSGALFVRVGDTWHLVPNLASARLIAATAADPRPVRDSDLGRMKRGPLLGIPGAPQFIGKPLSAAESSWAICDTKGTGATTVIAGRTGGASGRRLAPGEAILVAPAPGSPAYLLYDGQRAVVDLADASVLRALRLDGRRPRPVSRSLLNAVPEVPPLAAPRINATGGPASGLSGFPIGTVLRITRGDGDEYYVVLDAGVQRIGRVAADLLRFRNSQDTANVMTVAPDVIRTAPIVDTLPVASFPDRAPTLPDGGSTLCVAWGPAQPGRPDVALLSGNRLPVPVGHTPVTLAQADGRGPALDAVYLPPGRSAYVREGGRGGTRYLVTDTGVRFAIHDDDAAHDLGLPASQPAPPPVLAVLPTGPELSRRNASIARDAVGRTP